MSKYILNKTWKKWIPEEVDNVDVNNNKHKFYDKKKMTIEMVL